MQLDTENHAVAISYFFSERKNDLENLAEDRAVVAFFENRALGLSMEYGLWESVFAIAKVFDQFINNRKLGAYNIFTRIVFLENHGTVLVDQPEDRSKPPKGQNWEKFLPTEPLVPKIGVESQGKSWRIKISIPYFFKGAFSGQIIAWVSSESIYHNFLKTTAGDSERVLAIINARGEPLHSPSGPVQDIRLLGAYELNHHAALPLGVHRFKSIPKNGSQVDMIAVRVPIPDTPFFLVAMAPATAVFGHASPRQLLAIMGILSFAIVGGVAIMLRANTRNLVLRARVDEAAASRQELEAKNCQLEQEICERQLAEKTLQESEEKYRLLVSQIPAMVFRGYSDWSIDPLDDKVEALTGYAKDDFDSRRVKWCDLIPAEDLDYATSVFIEALKTDKSYVREHRLRKKDGEIIWVQCRGRIFCDDQGKVEYISGVSFDVTERRRAEEAAREGEFFLSYIFASIQDGITVLDKEYTIVRVNQAMERAYAHALPLLGKKCYEAFRGRQQPCEICPTRSTLETGLAAREMVVIEAGASGEIIRYVELYTFPMTDMSSGQIKGVVEYVRDVTERQQVEEALRKSEENLRQVVKMEAVGQLAGGVAHDFNNILTAITGYGELLLMNLDPNDPVRLDVQDILVAAARAASLTRQLLAFSRKQVLQPQRLDLNEVVANLDKMLRRIIGEDIDLATIPGPELGMVMADPGQIEQVIMNLVVNARDAMPQGGNLTIETANADLDEVYSQRRTPVQPGPYVMLAVSDTGVGLDRESQERIFEPFFTTKKLGKGTGLGLSTVYGIIMQSGGYIWVYSEPGRGTTFKIYLPRIEAPAQLVTESQIPDRCELGAETILLVEDEDLVRQVTSRILARHGYTVLEAASGPDALLVSQAHPGPVHLMLTDVVMPGMCGPELVEKLKSQRPQMKVLFMSGHTENAIVHHGVLNPGIAFIQKPYRYDTLVRKMQEVLDASQDE